jgi:predicted nuclease of predicted toxin-antitoxin system
MRFLLDENLEHEVFHRLQNYDHEVVHVDLSSELNKGDSDTALATFSREQNFVIVTYDDDFRDEFSDDDYHAVLYLPDQTLSAKTIAKALHEISTYYQQSDLQGFMTIGKSWL